MQRCAQHIFTASVWNMREFVVIIIDLLDWHKLCPSPGTSTWYRLETQDRMSVLWQSPGGTPGEGNGKPPQKKKPFPRKTWQYKIGHRYVHRRVGPPRGSTVDRELLGLRLQALVRSVHPNWKMSGGSSPLSAGRIYEGTGPKPEQESNAWRSRQGRRLPP